MLHPTVRVIPFLRRIQHQLRVMSTQITVTPQQGLVDDPLRIQVSGLQSGQKVTLQTFLQDHKFKFISCGQYNADERGFIDVSKHASVGGCYQGVESTGLIWSMVQAPGQRDGLRLMKRDATTPYDVQVYVHDGHVDLESCYEKQNGDADIIARSAFHRTYKHNDVTRRQITEGRLRGALYTPPGEGPFPVILDLFGTAGGLFETRAALLASRGFQVLALAYFAYDDLQPFLSVLDMDYFEEAVNFLTNLQTYNGHGVGVVGTSKGGEIAISMSELMPIVKAVVSVNGLYFRSTTPVKYKNEDLPMFTPDYSKCRMVDDALYLIDCFDFDKNVPDDAVIKVEKSKAEFLIITSGDDGQCPAWTTEIVTQRLRDHGKQNFEYINYEGAGHLLEAPHSPFCKASYHSKFYCNLLWGGDIVTHTRAQEDSWPRILKFLAENLGGNIPSSKL